VIKFKYEVPVTFPEATEKTHDVGLPIQRPGKIKKRQEYCQSRCSAHQNTFDTTDPHNKSKATIDLLFC
jgi:hypothetical protein